MAEPYVPSIIYPNGGEIITDKNITISWTSLSQYDPSNRDVVFELYFTDNYENYNIPDWKLIAEINSSQEEFEWNFNNSINSDACRIGIRSRNSRGERSDFNISANNFTIKRQKLITPIIISPINNQKVNNFIEFIVDKESIRNSFSQRAFLQIYYSSEKNNIAKTIIVENYPVLESNFIWNATDKISSDDYKFEIYLSDDNGNVSEPVIIKNINLVHEGYFYIDTIPPEASIFINNDDVFTNKNDVNIEILAYDKTTKVHSVRFLEGTNYGSADNDGEVRPFSFTSGDGIKTVELITQDFGANRIGDSGKNINLLLKNIEETGSSLVDICSLDNYTWAISDGVSNKLYKCGQFPIEILTITDTPTSISSYKSNIYIGTELNNSGKLWLLSGNTLTLKKEFSESDSKINSMVENDNIFNIGLENGEVWKYDESNFNLVYTFLNPIKSLYSDKNILFATEKNEETIYIYNGISFILID